MPDFDHPRDNDPSFYRANSPDVNSRILIIAIISLSVVVIVVTMLHIYARYILRRQAQRRVALRQIGFVTRIHSEEPPKRGLEPMVIASLPTLIYKDKNHEPEHSGSNPECAVCLSMFEDGQIIRALPNCKHHFHAECIDKWLGSQSSCPICRHEVSSGATIQPLPREPSTRLGISAGPPSAPPIECTDCVITTSIEGTSDEMVQTSAKVNGTNSRLSSFRRMLSMDRSTRRVNSCTQDGVEDLERQ
ncbi:E3 ubiquitin-protein ligase ATL41-like [Rutidosis leptorrhynchoides]|uniref:E3 ubiquitin-protein ligase ATL41-like n=1 Tax=Rutidosis leptorrhynchoides TaxID=125765 RepID=UPI003A9923EF